MSSQKLTKEHELVLTVAIKKIEDVYNYLGRMNLYGVSSPGMQLHALLTGVVSRFEGDGVQLKMIDALKKLNWESFDWENDPVE